MPEPDLENPKPQIFLRNRMRLKRGAAMQFLKGKDDFLHQTKKRLRVPDHPELCTWSLIAAGSEKPIVFGESLPEEPQELIQIWRLDDWSTLYTSIFAFSEEDWYRRLGQSLSDEEQELLVNITSGSQIQPRDPWGERKQERVYVYEQVRVPFGTAHQYLRELNWFGTQVIDHGWKRIWAAGQITAQPSTLCTLWQVPSLQEVDATLTALLSNPATYPRYVRFLDLASELERKIYYPLFTEKLDELIQNGDSPVVIPDLPDTTI